MTPSRLLKLWVTKQPGHVPEKTDLKWIPIRYVSNSSAPYVHSTVDEKRTMNRWGKNDLFKDQKKKQLDNEAAHRWTS